MPMLLTHALNPQLYRLAYARDHYEGDWCGWEARNTVIIQITSLDVPGSPNLAIIILHDP